MLYINCTKPKIKNRRVDFAQVTFLFESNKIQDKNKKKTEKIN